MKIQNIQNITLDNKNNIVIQQENNDIIILSYDVAQEIARIAHTQACTQVFIDYFSDEQNGYKKDILNNTELISDLVSEYEHRCENCIDMPCVADPEFTQIITTDEDVQRYKKSYINTTESTNDY